MQLQRSIAGSQHISRKQTIQLFFILLRSRAPIVRKRAKYSKRTETVQTEVQENLNFAAPNDLCGNSELPPPITQTPLHLLHFYTAKRYDGEEWQPQRTHRTHNRRGTVPISLFMISKIDILPCLTGIEN